MKFDRPSEDLALHRKMMDDFDLGDEEGWPPLRRVSELSVADLIFIRKLVGESFIDRVNLFIEYGIMCDHPSGHRRFNPTRRWFRCDVCETTSIFVDNAFPPSPSAPYPGGSPVAQAPERMAAA